MKSKKLVGAAAFAAALAGGAAAGALIGAPAISSAQDNPSSSSSDAPSTDSSTTTPPAPGDCAGGFHGEHGFFGAKLDTAASALGMTTDELRTELEAGKSIADVAGEKGVDVQTVIDAIVSAETAQIDQAVTDGKLTQQQADDIKANLTERVTNFVNNTGPMGPHGPGMGRGHHGPRPNDNDADDSSSSDSTSS